MMLGGVCMYVCVHMSVCIVCTYVCVYCVTSALSITKRFIITVMLLLKKIID